MKSYSGRWIIISFLIICVALGVVLYRVFKDSGSYKDSVLSQIEREFTDYSLKQKNEERVLVAQVQSISYFIDLKKKWDFQLHKKILVVKPPAFEPLPEKSVEDEVQKQAKTQITLLLEDWAKAKFHSLKDINLQIQF